MKPLYPVILLTISNIFMTFAWYGHLKFKSTALWTVVLASWGIAFLNTAFRFRPTALGTNFLPLHSSKLCRKP